MTKLMKWAWDHPLSPIVANFFKGNLFKEEICLDRVQAILHHTYCRYIADISDIFKEKEPSLPFLN